MQPGLAFVRVGEDPASRVYVGMKEKACAQLGIFSETHVLPEATTEAELLALLARLNADARIHGILVQAPLPRQIREAVVYATVSPQKDVDGFHPVNVGKLMLGDTSGFRALHAGGRSGIARAVAGADGRRGSGDSRARKHRRQTDGGDSLPEGETRQCHRDHLPFAARGTSGRIAGARIF